LKGLPAPKPKEIPGAKITLVGSWKHMNGHTHTFKKSGELINETTGSKGVWKMTSTSKFTVKWQHKPGWHPQEITSQGNQLKNAKDGVWAKRIK
jgi:hypothetical protein